MENYKNVDTTTLIDLIIDRATCMIDEAAELETMVKELCFREPLKDNFKTYVDHIYYTRTSQNWYKTIGNHMLQDQAALKTLIAAYQLGAQPEDVLQQKKSIHIEEIVKEFAMEPKPVKIDVGTILIANATFGNHHVIDFKKGSEYKIKSIVGNMFRLVSETGSIEDIDMLEIGNDKLFSIKP